MEYFLILIYMFLFPITVITFLWRILDSIESLKEQPKEAKTKRRHTSIEKSNYDNAFGGRKAYEIYKNNSGLYEPITPSRGIKIDKKEE